MKQYQVVEIFESINGEGTKAGQLAIFVRFKGCNLNCSFCDTKWANEKDAKYTLMTTKEIVNRIIESKILNVTLTGGEPLIQKDIKDLLTELSKYKDIFVEIETNGSVSLKPFLDITNGPSFTMDYKLKGSCMEEKMCLDNLKLLRNMDTLKFVCSNKEDLDKALQVITQYDLVNKCHIYLSPVFSSIDPKDMVEYMKEHNMNNINLQIQMHKVIWDPNQKGV